MSEKKETTFKRKATTKAKRKPGAKRGKAHKTSSSDLFRPDPKDGVEPIVPDLFDARPAGHRSGHAPSKLGGVDRLAHDINLLKVEWAIKWPLITPRTFLIEKKGYSIHQTNAILAEAGGRSEWDLERGRILDKMTETTVLRHVDQMAEVQETHVKASKIGLTKAIEMLTKLTVEPAKDAEGKLIKDASGKVVHKGFRSIDLLNVMSSIEKAQQIYRRAMGLPNDEGGLAQILERVSLIQNNTHVHVEEHHHEAAEPVEKTEKEKAIDKLTYDDIMEFIEYRREQKARSAAKEN